MFHKKKKHVTITKERTQKSPLLVCALFSAFACVCVCVCLGVQKREKDAACVDGCSAIKCVRRNGEIANNNNQPTKLTHTDRSTKGSSAISISLMP